MCALTGEIKSIASVTPWPMIDETRVDSCNRGMFCQLGNAKRQVNTKLAQYQFGFHRHASGDNAVVFAWHGLRRRGVCSRLKGRHRGTVPTCRRRSLSPQSLEADTSTTPRGSHRHRVRVVRRQTSVSGGDFERYRDLSVGHQATGLLMFS